MKKKGVYPLPKFYSKYLGPKLKDKIQELLEAPHDEQIALYEELAIARSNACQALKLAQPLWDEKQSKKLEPETKALILSTVNDAMDHVKDMVLAASRVEKDAADKVSVKVLNLVVMQIVYAINDVCGTENLKIAQAIERAIDERVRLPMNSQLASRLVVTVGEDGDRDGNRQLEDS
jgi:hypothetical protein